MSDALSAKIIGFERPAPLDATFLTVVYQMGDTTGVLDWDDGERSEASFIPVQVCENEFISIAGTCCDSVIRFQIKSISGGSIEDHVAAPLVAFLMPSHEILCGSETDLRVELTQRLDELEQYHFAFLDVCDFTNLPMRAEEMTTKIVADLNRLRDGAGDRWKQLNCAHSASTLAKGDGAKSKLYYFHTLNLHKTGPYEIL